MSIGLWRVAEANHLLVASTLALFDKACADPPDQWMKPEERFDEHVCGGGEVIVILDVRELMSQNCFQLRWSKPLGNSLRQDHDGAKDAKHAGLAHGVRGSRGYVGVQMQWFGGAHFCAQEAPADAPEDGNGDKAAGPQDEHDVRDRSGACGSNRHYLC